VQWACASVRRRQRVAVGQREVDEARAGRRAVPEVRRLGTQSA